MFGLLGVETAGESMRRRSRHVVDGTALGGFGGGCAPATCPAGLQCQDRHVALQRVAGSTGALLDGQQAIGVDLRLEPREEGGSTGLGGRSALSVERVRSGSGTQSSFGGGKRKRHRRSLSTSSRRRGQVGIGGAHGRRRSARESITKCAYSSTPRAVTCRVLSQPPSPSTGRRPRPRVDPGAARTGSSKAGGRHLAVPRRPPRRRAGHIGLPPVRRHRP